MKYASEVPGDDDKERTQNKDDWEKQYRSADCSIYRYPAVGEWREMSNALRVSGYTRILALQR
jgi:hypothetical protein